MICAKCGSENPDTNRFCFSCGAPVMRQEPAEAPVKEPPPVEVREVPVVRETGRIARLGDRFLAVLLDGLLIIAMFCVIGMWAAVTWGGLTKNGFSLEGKPALIAIALTLLFSFLYYWLMEGMIGATLGKMILGIKVTTLSGEKCNLTGSLVRNLLRIIDGQFAYLIGFLVALFSKRRQRIGDHLAKTVVVEKTAGKASRVIPAIFWLVIVLAALIFAFLLHRDPDGSSSDVATTGLKISRFEFLESRDGKVRTSTTYRPGDKIFTRYDISGFIIDQQGTANLKIAIAVTDPHETPLARWQGDLNQNVSADRTANGSFNFNLVPWVPPGTFMIRITIQDVVRKKSSEQAFPFTVDAPPAVIASTLELRDARLSLSDEGPPLDPPTVKPGTTVYLNGKLAGMRFAGEKIHIKVAFQLLGPKGEILMDKPDFIEVNESIDYHPSSFFLPISTNVTLPQAAPSGTYTENYVVTDLHSNASSTFSIKVEVR